MMGLVDRMPRSGPTSGLAQGQPKYSENVSIFVLHIHSLCYQMLLLKKKVSPFACSDLTQVNTTSNFTPSVTVSFDSHWPRHRIII